MKCVKVVCERIRTAEKFEFGAEQKRVNRVDLKNAAKSASDKISSNAKIGFGTWSMHGRPRPTIENDGSMWNDTRHPRNVPCTDLLEPTCRALVQQIDIHCWERCVLLQHVVTTVRACQQNASCGHGDYRYGFRDFYYKSPSPTLSLTPTL